MPRGRKQESLGPEAMRQGYMEHIADPAGAVVVGCKVLPIFNEHGIAMKVVHRMDGKKAVARVKELLKRAAQARPHRATTGGKKWKKVLSFQATSDVAKGGQQLKHEEESEGLSCSSSKLSFKWEWDVGSCSSVSASSALYSPRSLVSKDAEQMLTPSRKHHCMSRFSSMSQHNASLLDLELDPAIVLPKSTEGEETCRMGQWITTDSDFVVLEL